MKIDLTGLNRLAYRGFETEEEQASKDELIAKGCTLVEDAENPFSPPPAPEATNGKPVDTSALQRLVEPPRADDSKRYKEVFRDAFNFLSKYSPPTLSPTYWDEAATTFAELGEKYGDDKLAASILVAVYEELERSYQKLAQ